MEQLQTISSVPLDSIVPYKSNPRTIFDQKAFADLVQSIKEKGIIVPLLVRPGGGTVTRFEIIAGERRYQAAKKLGLKEVPAIVRELSDEEAAELAIVDNLQREGIHPLDEAQGYRELMNRSQVDAAGVAARIGKSPAYVYQRLALCSLIDPARKAFLSDRMQLGHALLIARLQPDEQKDVLNYGVLGQAMTVRDLARHIREEILLDLSGAPWKKDDKSLVPATGACNVCPKHTAHNPELFQDFGKGDKCLDGKCFASKMKAFLDVTRAELKKAGFPVKDISLEYGGYGRNKSILYENNYRTWKGCGNQVTGLVVEGRNIGTTKKICLDSQCKRCNPSDSYSYSPGKKTPESRYKRRMEIWENKITQEYRERIFKAVVPLIKGPAKRIHLVALLREVDNNHGGSLQDVAKLLGKKWSDYIRGMGDLEDYQKKTASWTEDEILRGAIGLALRQEMVQDPSMGPPEDELLTPLAKLHGEKKIDLQVIKKLVRVHLETKKPKPPKKDEKKSPKKKAKK